MRRRTLISKILILVICLAFSASSMAGESTNIGADDALSRLLSENKRFVAGKSNEPTGPALIERRHALAKDQKPFAVVVGCSDSRVPPELVFDVSLGDIFVVRTAGEVVGEVGLGSIEYAVEHLGTHLIVVLGHQRCGAVSAAVAGATETGDIPKVLRAISPAIEETRAVRRSNRKCRPRERTPHRKTLTERRSYHRAPRAVGGSKGRRSVLQSRYRAG